MKIKKHEIIRLGNGEKYFIVKGKNIDGRNFCLLSTLQAPIEMKLAEMCVNDDGVIEVMEYISPDYKEILFKLF